MQKIFRHIKNFFLISPNFRKHTKNFPHMFKIFFGTFGTKLRMDLEYMIIELGKRLLH